MLLLTVEYTKTGSMPVIPSRIPMILPKSASWLNLWDMLPVWDEQIQPKHEKISEMSRDYSLLLSTQLLFAVRH